MQDYINWIKIIALQCVHVTTVQIIVKHYGNTGTHRLVNRVRLMVPRGKAVPKAYSVVHTKLNLAIFEER